MTRAPTAQDAGYPAIGWPVGSDREHYRELAEQAHVLNRKGDLAKAMAMIDAGSKAFVQAVPHPVHGFAIVDRAA
jgi:hypothetical protein